MFHSHAPVLVPTVITSVSDQFYKISSEALLVLECLVKVIRPIEAVGAAAGQQEEKEDPNFRSYVQPVGTKYAFMCNENGFKRVLSQIYDCCFTRLSATDMDQEVKERAISTMGSILAHLGDCLGAQLPACLPIMLDRLNNEITRLTAVRAITRIAQSPLKIPLVAILQGTLNTLASFLRKNNRALKLATLILLDTLLRNYHKDLAGGALLQPVLAELPPLLGEADLHVAQLAMNLLASVARLQPASLSVVAATSLPEILLLARSPLLQVRPRRRNKKKTFL